MFRLKAHTFTPSWVSNKKSCTISLIKAACRGLNLFCHRYWKPLGRSFMNVQVHVEGPILYECTSACRRADTLWMYKCSWRMKGKTVIIALRPQFLYIFYFKFSPFLSQFGSQLHPHFSNYPVLLALDSPHTPRLWRPQIGSGVPWETYAFIKPYELDWLPWFQVPEVREMWQSKPSPESSPLGVMSQLCHSNASLAETGFETLGE